MPTEVRVVSGAEFRRVVIALREVDDTLPAKFRRAVRDAAKPLMAKAKEEVLTLPTVGRQHSGLRKRVARGVRARMNRGTSVIRISTSMPDKTEAMLPRGLDREKGWRHPVFGDDNHWVQQRGYSWFIDTMKDGREPLQKDLTDVLDEAANVVKRAGG